MKEHALWNELGNLYFLVGSHDRAIRAYNHALDLSPERGEPYINLALTYAQLGKLDEASDYYKRGIPLLDDELDKAVSLHRLGDIYIQLKQFAQAAETYRQSEELMPELGKIIADNKPADFLLLCPLSDLKPEQTGHTNGELSQNSFETWMPPFVEELTPWWFDDQIVPKEEPDADNDYWYMNDAGVHSQNESIFSIEPLTWETDQSREAGITVDTHQSADIADEANTDCLDTTEVEQSESMNSSETDGAVEIGHNDQGGDDEVLDNEPPSAPTVMVVTDKPEIVTVSPEFSSECITNPEAVKYELSIDWPAVELSQAERLEIQSEINKFKRVLEINPRNAFAWDSLGGSYKALGQYDEAIDAFRKAVNLDSTKAFYFHHLGLVYAVVGRYDEAIDAFERVIEVDPNHSLAHATLGGYYRKKGNEELATEHIEKARTLLANDENEYNRACMEAICGNTDQSLELLELALKNRQTYVNWARKDPDLDFIRSDPRFHALLAEYAVKTA